jgi:hypothetical protein
VIVILGMGVCLDLEDLAGGESPRMGRPWEEYGWFTRPVPPKKEANESDKNKPPKKEENESDKIKPLEKQANENDKIKPLKKQANESEKKPPKREAILFRNLPRDFWMTRTICLTLAICWFALLISVAALKENSWYLLAVGAIGMFQNAVVAGIRVKPEGRGIHVKFLKNISRGKVMHALMDFEVNYEAHYPKIGKSLVDEFFPGGLKENERKWWEGDRKAYDTKRFGENGRPEVSQSTQFDSQHNPPQNSQ